ncbi:hypothetical protein N656DRAFT_777972 [Canariomyces notabilis]|uniref:Uncharacterized protein n=1 Tax=Canariomyces notabilis TaxID=2074819 RepID=A0AAN6YUX2_9PEZI|nr:hypothetical protein N656DRAFT_777972 [Canariomyces arenarius]
MTRLWRKQVGSTSEARPVPTLKPSRAYTTLLCLTAAHSSVHSLRVVYGGGRAHPDVIALLVLVLALPPGYITYTAKREPKLTLMRQSTYCV